MENVQAGYGELQEFIPQLATPVAGRNPVFVALHQPLMKHLTWKSLRPTSKHGHRGKGSSRLANGHCMVDPRSRPASCFCSGPVDSFKVLRMLAMDPCCFPGFGPAGRWKWPGFSIVYDHFRRDMQRFVFRGVMLQLLSYCRPCVPPHCWTSQLVQAQSPSCVRER